MTDYLLRLGHRRIGFIKGHPSHTSSAQRLLGFEAALRNTDCKVGDVVLAQGYYSYRSGLEAGEQLLSGSTIPTAMSGMDVEMPYAKHVYHLFVIRIREEIREKREERRNGLMRYLNENGVATGLHYPVPLHLQNCFKYLGYKKGDFPVSEELAETGLSLPMFPD